MRWRELFQQGRARLTVGILLVEFLVAVQSLVVTAILPAISPIVTPATVVMDIPLTTL